MNSSKTGHCPIEKSHTENVFEFDIVQLFIARLHSDFHTKVVEADKDKTLPKEVLEAETLMANQKGLSGSDHEILTFPETKQSKWTWI